MKKIYYVLLVVAVAVLFTGCQSKEKNLTGSLKDIMKEVYSGIPSDELPAMAEIDVYKRQPVKKDKTHIRKMLIFFI